jgi:hypothetical protein
MLAERCLTKNYLLHVPFIKKLKTVMHSERKHTVFSWEQGTEE